MHAGAAGYGALLLLLHQVHHLRPLPLPCLNPASHTLLLLLHQPKGLLPCEHPAEVQQQLHVIGTQTMKALAACLTLPLRQRYWLPQPGCLQAGATGLQPWVQMTAQRLMMLQGLLLCCKHSWRVLLLSERQLQQHLA
jgi:hypothetical protein